MSNNITIYPLTNRKYAVLLKNGRILAIEQAQKDAVFRYYSTGESIADPLLHSLVSENQAQQIHGSQYIALTLNISNCCNMNCKYCFEHGDTYQMKEQIMSAETALKAVDYFVQNYPGIRRLKFFGGEPLLNLKVIQAVCSHLQEYCEQGRIAFLPEYRIITNGTLISEAFADLVNTYSIQVIVSVDGPEPIHNANRVMKDGSGSFHLVKEKIAFLQAKTGGKQPVSLEATYTRAHETSPMDVADTVKSLKNLFGVDRINLSEVMSNNPEIQLNEGQGIYPALPKIFRRLSDHEDVMPQKVQDMLKRIRKGAVSEERICGAAINSFAVAADGSVYPCYMMIGNPEFYMGSIQKPETIQSIGSRICAQFRAQTRLDSEKCLQCDAYPYCVGCMGINHAVTGSCFESSPEYCRTMRELIRQCVVYLVEHDYERYKLH